jgi:hypothetical protein
MGAGLPCTGYEAVLSVYYSTMTDVAPSSTFRNFPHQQLFKSTPTAALKDIGMYLTRLLRQSLMGRGSVTTLLGYALKRRGTEVATRREVKFVSLSSRT